MPLSSETWQAALKPAGNGFTLSMEEVFKDNAFISQNPDGEAYVLEYTTTLQNNLIDKAAYKNTFDIKYVTI